MTDVEINGRLMALQRQRDEALNQVVLLMGEIAVLKARLDACEPKKDAADQPSVPV